MEFSSGIEAFTVISTLYLLSGVSIYFSEVNRDVFEQRKWASHRAAIILWPLLIVMQFVGLIFTIHMPSIFKDYAKRLIEDIWSIAIIAMVIGAAWGGASAIVSES